MSTETKGVMIYDLNAFEILIVLSIQTILIFMMLFMFMIKTFLPDLHFVPIIIIVSFTIHTAPEINDSKLQPTFFIHCVPT